MLNVEMKLKNVRLLFFPANFTSVMQPLDQGIIHAVKAWFRKLLIEWLIIHADKEIESGAEKIVCIHVVFSVFCYDRSWYFSISLFRIYRRLHFCYLLMLKEAWHHLLEATIRHCFIHAGIVPARYLKQLQDTDSGFGSICFILLSLCTVPSFLSFCLCFLLSVLFCGPGEVPQFITALEELRVSIGRAQSLGHFDAEAKDFVEVDDQSVSILHLLFPVLPLSFLPPCMQPTDDSETGDDWLTQNVAAHCGIVQEEKEEDDSGDPPASISFVQFSFAVDTVRTYLEQQDLPVSHISALKS